MGCPSHKWIIPTSTLFYGVSSEQYLLAAYLLGGKRLDIVLANAFITRDERLYRILEPIWTAPAMSHAGRYGASLWTVTLKDAIHVAVPPRG